MFSKRKMIRRKIKIKRNDLFYYFLNKFRLCSKAGIKLAFALADTNRKPL